jgi:hypothetical protein
VLYQSGLIKINNTSFINTGDNFISSIETYKPTLRQKEGENENLY